ncbi:MAG: adenylate/guanylate cyclase domain-containing protein [Haloechinothrix sp.]
MDRDGNVDDQAESSSALVSEETQERIEQVLLGGQRRYTRAEVAEMSGVPLTRAQSRWRALGFAGVAGDDAVFTDADVEAAAISERLVESGLISIDMDASVTRALGHHLSRLAEWQSDLVWEVLARRPDIAQDESQVVQIIEAAVPALERVQNYVWRRHLAAFACRALATSDEAMASRKQAVGFVDMVGYTRLTRQLDESGLSAVLEKFEALAGSVIAERHGRIVKMIGDEVLFVADTASDAAEIALVLNGRAEEDDDIPELRTGLAYGHVLNRLGDVYGPVVNIAARLTSTARPGTILLDHEFATQFGDSAGYEFRSLRPVSVRGYSKLRRFVLRRESR